MIACGRSVKALHPDALTIFVGPCIAKKAEAREKDLAGAGRLRADLPGGAGHLRGGGDRPGQAGGPRARPLLPRGAHLRAHRRGERGGPLDRRAAQPPPQNFDAHPQADGVPGCRALIDDLLAGKIDANFFEGMGCVGGCVGGPKRIIPREEGERNVDAYGGDAASPTPIDNPYVIELLGGWDIPRWKACSPKTTSSPANSEKHQARAAADAAALAFYSVSAQVKRPLSQPKKPWASPRRGRPSPRRVRES